MHMGRSNARLTWLVASRLVAWPGPVGIVLAAACLLVAACSGGAGERPDAGLAVDAAADGQPVTLEPVIEQVIDQGPTLSERDTYPDGGPLIVPWRIIDDCRVCMAGDFGPRCGRRSACSTPTCVLTDGSTMSAGETLDTPWCHTCTCAPDGTLTCLRRTDGPCASDRCVAMFKGSPVDLGLGEEQFVSECHVMTCDQQLGLRVMDICHDGCLSPSGRVPLYFAGLHTDGCSICTCLYGSYCCSDAQLCDSPGASICPLPGASCQDELGQEVASGGYGRFGGQECRCVDGAFVCPQ